MHTHLLSTKTLATLERTARSCLRSTLRIFGKYNSSIFKNKLTCLSIRNITTLQHGHFLNHYVNRILNDDNSASRTLNILMNNYYSQPSTNPANHPLQLHNPGAITRSKLKTITQLLCTAKHNQLLLLRPKDTPRCLLPYERKLPLSPDLTNKLAAWPFAPLSNEDANTIANIHLATFPEDFQLTKHEPLNTPHNNAPLLIATDGSFKDGVAAAAVVTATTRYSAPPLGCHSSFNAEASAIAYALEATASIPSVHIISDNKAMVYLLKEPPKRSPLKAVAAWRIISQHLKTRNISIAHVYSHQEKKTSKEWKEKIAKQRLLHPNDYDQRVLLNREADKRASLAQRTIAACNLHPLRTLALLPNEVTMIWNLKTCTWEDHDIRNLLKNRHPKVNKQLKHSPLSTRHYNHLIRTKYELLPLCNYINNSSKRLYADKYCKICMKNGKRCLETTEHLYTACVVSQKLTAKMIVDIKTYNVLISSLLAQQAKNLDFWKGELPYYLTVHGTNNKDINSITRIIDSTRTNIFLKRNEKLKKLHYLNNS